MRKLLAYFYLAITTLLLISCGQRQLQSQSGQTAFLPNTQGNPLPELSVDTEDINDALIDPSTRNQVQSEQEGDLFDWFSQLINGEAQASSAILSLSQFISQVSANLGQTIARVQALETRPRVQVTNKCGWAYSPTNCQRGSAVHVTSCPKGRVVVKSQTQQICRVDNSTYKTVTHHYCCEIA